MTNILKTDLHFYLLIYHHQNHLCLTNNISKSSTPGFNATIFQDHLHFTSFKHELLQQNNINSSTKNVDAEEQTNENNVDSQEQIRQLTPNENLNMIDYCQFTMQSLMECSEIVGGLKRQLHYKINMSK